MKQGNESKKVMDFNCFDTVLITEDFDNFENVGKVTTIITPVGESCYSCADGNVYHESQIGYTDLLSDDVIYEKQPEDILLSQAELQFLVKYLSSDINSNESGIKYHKDEASEFWKLSDVNNINTIEDFRNLNYNKTTVRYLKALNGKLASIQRKLKKQMS